MKKLIPCLVMALFVGCATTPYDGTYRSEQGLLTLTRDGHLSYRDGGLRGEGSYRTTGQDRISARVDKQELRLLIDGAEKKAEWVSKGPEQWHFVVVPLDGTCRKFPEADQAERYREFLSKRTTSCLIEGAVQKPRVCPCDGKLTLAEIVGMAGGYKRSRWAWISGASIARSNETIRISLKRSAKEDREVAVFPGDIIEIEQSMGL